jgi:O-antigen/teichoic acid export membrane protein
VDSTTTLPVTSASTAKRCPETLPPLSLRRNFSWTLLGNVVYAGCQWGTIVVLAKLGTPEMVGQFALAVAIVTPVIMFSNLQLRAIQATDASGEGLFGHYLALRLLTTTVALALVGMIAWVGGYRSEVAWVILLVGVSRALEAVSDVYFGLFQQCERMDRIAVSMMVKGPLMLAFLGVGVWLSGGILGGLVGMVLARAIALVAIDVGNAFRLRSSLQTAQARSAAHAPAGSNSLMPRWDGRVLTSITWRSLPLGVTTLLISLNASIPRFFLEGHLGERALGIFASIAYFAVVGTTIVSALGQSASPRLAKYFVERNDVAFRRLLVKMVAISGVVGALGIVVAAVAGRAVLSWCYQPEYAEHADMLVGLMVAGMLGFLAVPFGCAATATRRIRYQPVALLFVVLVSLIASYWLIGSQGLWGAVLSTTATSAATLIAYRLLLPLRGRLT